ncbi:thiamine-phosphate kinase [Caldimonas sp. KR1-144]|uniref:thiamine-phosphate kinase n=1 Tax=Caldimonas sp. KR1-144 TaxID=3400911 RepID=UPI003BFC66EB
MSLGEFELIARHFARHSGAAARAFAPGVALGPGDDCALLAPRAGMQLAVSSDMLVEGRHFLSTVAPARLGHKALAVNLSDLAAVGAQPLAFTLALAMPRADDRWLAGFAEGLYTLADAHRCALVGGDTTAGPLNLCITVFGEVPAGGALLRSGARPGHALWVSHPSGGGIGDARLALECFRGTVALEGAAFERVRRAMEMPQPRVALGIALRGVASAAIDVSDGLLGDLGHILRNSGAAGAPLGATIEVDSLPASADLAGQPDHWRRTCTLSGGDDYELLFTAPEAAAERVRAAAHEAGVGARCIGRIEPAPGIRLLDAGGGLLDWATFRSFDHFRDDGDER